jgi:O-antigen/teichoic acid export membrane protein
VLALFQTLILVGNGPLGLAGIGAFTLVGNLVQFTDQADSIITGTLYPAICAVSDRLELLSEIFIKSNRLSLMWAVPFGVGMTLFGSDLIHFGLGHHWIPAIPLLQIMGIVTAVHHVGYNWSAFIQSRGFTWPIAVAGSVTCAAVLASAIPLMYDVGLIGIGYAFAIGEVVTLAIKAVVMTRFFTRISLFPHLLRAFAPTALAVIPILAFRAVHGGEHNSLAAVAVFAAYVVLTVVAPFALERPLLGEAVGYLISRRLTPA